jgi:tetratricopeptide (TPR) repeat protein
VLIGILLVAGMFFVDETACDQPKGNLARSSAEAAYAKGQFADAAQAFIEAFDVCPSEHSILLRLSEAQLRSHQAEAAVAAARRFLALEPSSTEGKMALANAYFMVQNFGEAQKLADGILHMNASDPNALKLKGNVQYLTGHTAEAIQTFFVLLDGHPKDADAAYMLGRIYYQEGRIEQATGQFERVLKLDPKSYKALDNLGLCHQALGDRELANRYFLTAIKVAEEQEARYDWAYANLASLLLETGDADHAFAAASKAVDRNPDSARDFYLGGKALQQLGRADLSINWLERSVSLDPKYPEPLYLLAKLYKQKGDEARAAATLEKFRMVKSAAPRERK